jgi:glucose-6-phosphate 1-dehydrogenase
MDTNRSDGLVVFGATGDLAYKQIFPALLGLVRDEGLAAPIIGVAKQGWTLDRLKQRALDSLKAHGLESDSDATGRLLAQLRYVDGDYNDQATFVELRKQLDQSQRPLHYLAIPPSMFGVVAGQLAKCPSGDSASHCNRLS